MTLDPALELEHVRFVRDGRSILDDVSLVVGPRERWLVLGANGSGKTSLVRIAALYEHPSRGVVRVAGQTLGTTDVRALRRRIGYVSASLADELRPGLDALDTVMTAKNAALEPWWHRYDDADHRRAAECLDRMGVGHLAHRTIGTLSSGERQRVLLARSLMNDPAIVLMDEPTARLDLGGRETVVSTLGRLVDDSTAPPVVLVTHHLDEVPPGMTHALLLESGRVLAAGPLDEVLHDDPLSQCFGVDLRLERRDDGRLTARVRH